MPAWTRADDPHAAAAFERAILGLGGDAPMIVADGTDLDGALDLAARAGCAGAGQVRAALDPAGGVEHGGGMAHAGVAGDRGIKPGSVVVR